MGCGGVLFLKSGCSGVEACLKMFVTETLFVEKVFNKIRCCHMCSIQSKVLLIEQHLRVS